MQRTVELEDFSVNCKEDLYTDILVKDSYDYHGCGQYEHHTPFGMCSSMQQFNYYLDFLTPDEIVQYRDEMNGSILHDMAANGLSPEYFRKIYNIIKYNNFVYLVKLHDRGGDDVITKTTNLATFRQLVKMCGINDYEMRRLMRYCTPEISNYLTNLINNEVHDDF